MMTPRSILRMAATVAACALLAISFTARAQDEEKHGRKYKAPPETCHITVQVLKGYNGKPIQNASIIFHPVKNGKDQGALQVKSDPEGRATIDVIPVGTTVRLQVIAKGFATYGEAFDLTDSSRDFLVKMEMPKEQISAYQDNTGKSLNRPVGVQEPHKAPVQPSSTPAPAPQSK